MIILKMLKGNNIEMRIWIQYQMKFNDQLMAIPATIKSKVLDYHSK